MWAVSLLCFLLPFSDGRPSLEEQRPDDILLSSRVCLSILYVTGTAFTSSCIPSPPPSHFPPPLSFLPPFSSPSSLPSSLPSTPRVVFVVFFMLNLLLWGAGSSAAIPFTTLLALLCLWFGISLPLTFFGSFLGFRKLVSLMPSSLPVRVVCGACESNALQSASEGSVWCL